jgi:ABC-2 type transport system permease protein
MKILYVAYYEFIKNLRDIKMLSCLLLFPICITYILGHAVGGYFDADIKDKISIGYINQDSGQVGKEYDSFLQNSEIKNRLNINIFKDKAEAQVALDKGEIDAAIYLPKDLTESLKSEKTSNIELYGKKNLEFVESITEGFVSSYNAIDTVIASGNTPSKINSSSNVERIYYTRSSKTASTIDYYAVLELFNVLILGAIFGVMIISKEDNSDMHIRLSSLPTRKFTLTAGRILGSSLFLFAISVFVMLFTKYVYHANWDGNIFIILGTLFAFSLISVGVGVLVKLFTPNFSSALMIVLLLMMFFGVVSGAISPSYAYGKICLLSPNYHGKILIFGAIYGYSKTIMLKSAIYLLSFIVLIFGISGVVMRRSKYDNI